MRKWDTEGKGACAVFGRERSRIPSITPLLLMCQSMNLPLRFFNTSWPKGIKLNLYEPLLAVPKVPTTKRHSKAFILHILQMEDMQ